MRVTVPSPTAASLGKFGDVPVNLYTGVPDISIPLFAAKGRTLQLPITLRYHAAGIRVEEIGGWVGIGWTLDAGGSITRTVRGLVDEQGGGFCSTGNTFKDPANWPDPPFSIIDNIRQEVIDGEPDQFFFSFAGRTGQFVMGPNTGPECQEYRAIPYQKLKIEPTSGFSSWVITTEDGTRYTFGAQEASTDFSTASDMSFLRHYGESYTSTWHLTEIISPGGDTITFEYVPYIARHRQGTYVERFLIFGGNACVPDQFEVRSEYEYATLRLSVIRTAAHVVTFSPGSTLRSDALSPSGAAQEPWLERITVTTPAGTVLRTVRFEYDYSIGGRLTLKRVVEEDRNGAPLPSYDFTYNSTALPDRTSYAIDHWGYYNGKTSNTSYIPADVTSWGGVMPGADRNPDPAYTRAGVLTKITYPTGGYNEFIYEANDYGAIGGDGTMPIGEGPEQVRNVSSLDPEPSITFTVGGSEPTTATIEVTQDPYDCTGSVFCPYGELDGVRYYSHDEFQNPYGPRYVTLTPGTHTLSASDGLTEGWATIRITWRDRGPLPKKTAGGLRVAEVRAADAMGNETIRKYKYTLQTDPSRSSGVISAEPAYSYEYSSPSCWYGSRSSMSKLPLGGGPIIGYREVRVWRGGNGEYGKTRHAFRSVLDAPDPLPEQWPFLRRTSYEWKRGQAVGVSEYDGSDQIQRRLASTHAFRDSEPETYRSFRGMSINTFGAQDYQVYYYNAFEVISAWAHQQSDTTVVYDEAGSASFSTARTYTHGNPTHMQLTELTETNSDGTERITRMKYPADYATAAADAVSAALTAMQGTAHIHDAVIERWVIEKTGTTEKIVQAELTTFKEYGPGQYLPYQRLVLNSPSPLP